MILLMMQSVIVMLVMDGNYASDNDNDDDDHDDDDHDDDDHDDDECANRKITMSHRHEISPSH